jgi:4-carboxymuconolactone decarboxylase
MSRLPDLPYAAMDAEQRRVYDAIASGPRGRVPALFLPWLLSPGMADPAQTLGAFVRLGSSLAKPLSELAILVTARHWDCAFEWAAHAVFARQAGVAEAVIEAVRRRETPDFDDPAAAAVHDFARQLLETRGVGDATYATAVAALGEKGVVELIGILGYYSLVAMTLNTFEIMPDEDAPAIGG